MTKIIEPSHMPGMVKVTDEHGTRHERVRGMGGVEFAPALRAVLDDLEPDEWWATERTDEAVVLTKHDDLVRVRATSIPKDQLPSMTPGEWQESDEPHPFGGGWAFPSHPSNRK